ncbi:MAG: DUF6517 family protein [Halodesulfurarchaeum sp.]
MRSPRVAFAAVVILVVLSGCSGGPGSKPPIEASAAAAGLSSQTISAGGFTRITARSERLNTSLSASIQGDVALQSVREVRATTTIRVYRGGASAEPVVVIVYTVPSVTLFPESARVVRNPAVPMSVGPLADRLQSIYTMGNLTTVEGPSVRLLGNGTIATVGEGTATVNGTSVDVSVRMVTVRHERDFVTVIHLVPQGAESDSAPSFQRVLAGVVHPKN